MLTNRTIARSNASDELATPLPSASVHVSPLAALHLAGVRMGYGRNEEIFGEGEPAEFLYRVISGTVRCSQLLADGRRQISAFYLPGDLFGLEVGGEHQTSAEAVGAADVLVVSRKTVTAMAERDAELASALWEAAARDLGRAREHMLLLGRKTAQERVTTFLLDMDARAGAGGAIELPMSRIDIADYLGLTIETVSRTFTQLEDEALIDLPASRSVRLRDPARLRDCAH